MSNRGLIELADLVQRGAKFLARSSITQKNEALAKAATYLLQRADEILLSNEADLKAAQSAGLDETALDRLRLDEHRIEAMSEGLLSVAREPDPLGEIVGGSVRPNGLFVSQVRVPLGVVGVIYENRPNVTSDVAGLCLKSGNAAFLRGSASAIRSNMAIVRIIQEALEKAELDKNTVTLVEDTSHETALEFMQLRSHIDCLVPRGSKSLIASLLEHATVPYVLDGDGNCHVYVDVHADLEMATSIVVNSKMQRPGVCNAAESLLVHAEVAEEFLPKVAKELEGVELRGDTSTCEILPDAKVATEDDFATEYLGPVMSVAVVSNLEEAIEHISRYGTGHSEAIVTRDIDAADRFVHEVDAAAVLVNASTRFIDGGELGLGAEVGISTQKLHVRGPLGLRALTCVKWVVRGKGQIRT